MGAVWVIIAILLFAALFVFVVKLVAIGQSYVLRHHIIAWAEENEYDIKKIGIRTFNTRPFVFIPNMMCLFHVAVSDQDGDVKKYWILTSSCSGKIFNIIPHGSRIRLNWRKIFKSLIVGTDDLYIVEEQIDEE